MMDRHEDGKPGSRKRLHALDELRGAAVLSMVAFHAAYDLAYLYGVDMPLFTSGWIQELWRVSISWTFLALAGWMTSLSRSNLRRGCQYAAVAVAIWIATSWAAVDTPISFGIIYCMAACTLLWWCLEHAFPQALTRWRVPAAFLCVVLFGVLYQVPRSRYAVGGLAWLGFPGPGFSSGDYYPLVPFFFLYAASALTARGWAQSHRAYPRWMYGRHVPALAWLGRHALVIYAVHQVAILLALEIIFM